jgi:hypothetical protein
MFAHMKNIIGKKKKNLYTDPNSKPTETPSPPFPLFDKHVNNNIRQNGSGAE